MFLLEYVLKDALVGQISWEKLGYFWPLRILLSNIIIYTILMLSQQQHSINVIYLVFHKEELYNSVPVHIENLTNLMEKIRVIIK